MNVELNRILLNVRTAQYLYRAGDIQQEYAFRQDHPYVDRAYLELFHATRRPASFVAFPLDHARPPDAILRPRSSL